MAAIAPDFRTPTAAPGAAAGVVRTTLPLRLAQGVCAVLRAALIYGEAGRLCPPPDTR